MVITGRFSLSLLEHFVGLTGRNGRTRKECLTHLVQRGIIHPTSSAAVALARCMVHMTGFNDNALSAYQLHWTPPFCLVYCDHKLISGWCQWQKLYLGHTLTVFSTSRHI